MFRQDSQTNETAVEGNVPELLAVENVLTDDEGCLSLLSLIKTLLYFYYHPGPCLSFHPSSNKQLCSLRPQRIHPPPVLTLTPHKPLCPWSDHVEAESFRPGVSFRSLSDCFSPSEKLRWPVSSSHYNQLLES